MGMGGFMSQSESGSGRTVDRPGSELTAEYVATVGSLFSGIGGIDLGLERAGFRVIWQSEVNKYANKVLTKHWPTVPNLGDVTKIDWSTVARPDVIAGGFPCQPVSLAGHQRGQDDERWLWPEYADAVRVLRPGHVLVENVPGLLVRGMGDVLGDLAELGYNCEWASLPAAAVGAPHLRWRVFVVGHSTVGDGVDVRRGGGNPVDPLGGAGAIQLQQSVRSGDGRGARTVAYTHCSGPQGRVLSDRRPGQRPPWEGGRPVTGHWDVEPDVGRVAHGIPRRVDRLRCLGNAVVPQVAEFVGRRLAAHIDGGGS